MTKNVSEIYRTGKDDMLMLYFTLNIKIFINGYNKRFL